MFNLFNKNRVLKYEKQAIDYVDNFYTGAKDDENVSRFDRCLYRLSRVLSGENAKMLYSYLEENAKYISQSSNETFYGRENIIKRLNYVHRVNKQDRYVHMASIVNTDDNTILRRCLIISYKSADNYKRIVNLAINNNGLIDKIEILEDYNIKFILDDTPYIVKTLVRNIQYCISIDDNDIKPQQKSQDSEIRYSRRGPATDRYDARHVAEILNNCSSMQRVKELSRLLDDSVNESFVEKTMYYIRLKDLKDSAVYKAAQIDRRLFSKMMSDKYYKPAKDTAMAISFALKLDLDETNDLLSRAGYTLSHSNKRDVIIEYFITRKIYNLNDINEVLFNLGQKIIGR